MILDKWLRGEITEMTDIENKENRRINLPFYKKISKFLFRRFTMQKKALIIGNNHYDNFASLNGCIADADEVARLLETNEDESVNFEVQKMTNIATKEILMQKIKQLFSGDSDIALFYFSGHGATLDGDEYICTADSNRTIPGVKTSDILSLANKSNCKNKIIILDSCHSGGMGHTSLVLSADLIGKGVTILTSSLDTQASMEIDGRGLFTVLLCEALKGGAADLFGKISPGSVYSFIDKALGSWQQRPVFKTNVKEFISLRDVKAPIDILKLKQITRLFKTPTENFALDPSFEFTNEAYNPDAVKPYAKKKNIEIFQTLQKFERVGLVVPVDEEFMYFAAMHSKSCKLTPLGQYYWLLADRKRF